VEIRLTGVMCEELRSSRPGKRGDSWLVKVGQVEQWQEVEGTCESMFGGGRPFPVGDCQSQRMRVEWAVNDG
jgi:hypothetical protein